MRTAAYLVKMILDRLLKKNSLQFAIFSELINCLFYSNKSFSYQIYSVPDFRLTTDCPPTPATAPPPPANALIHPVGALIFEEVSLVSRFE
jgi:hypothetical protein